MIAMQYNFTLPADYDMDIVRQRIASKGHMLDNFPGLAFKAYLYASKGQEPTKSSHNVYAPFYLWHDNEGLNNFICGDGFKAVSQAFGWPTVRQWSVWHGHVDAQVRSATFATREISQIEAYTDLGALRELETVAAKNMSKQAGALATLVAFDPNAWTLVRFTLWGDASAAQAAGLPDHVQAYEVGHVSAPGY
ncbi:DUF4865 domain-containing protein [Undibacterium sp. KW1]|uniref:DUF4865 family protein n=1 Tax=Undibacterium sp. KW1 TaxID=2058624 RepID=UPI001331EA85|nr:DUF4865 family protein [Undibacterium sp. KW1]BBB62162.1 DUF4865 domain-containing protein [Undibacterium sp. KW1]